MVGVLLGPGGGAVEELANIPALLELTFQVEEKRMSK